MRELEYRVAVYVRSDSATAGKLHILVENREVQLAASVGIAYVAHHREVTYVGIRLAPWIFADRHGDGLLSRRRKLPEYRLEKNVMLL